MIPKAPPSAANDPRTLFSHAAARFSRSGGTAAFFRSECSEQGMPSGGAK